MDGTLRTQDRALRRRARGEPLAALALARQLLRADRPGEAREILAERLAAGCLEGEVLGALAEIGWQTGRLEGDPRRERPRTHVDLLAARRRGRLGQPREVVPGIAVAGQGSYELAEGLLKRLACAAQARPYRCHGQSHIAFQLRLPSPWQLATGYVCRSVRLFTVPLGVESVKLRRRLLRSTSALLLAPSAREEELLELDRLSEAFRRVHACAPRAFPVVRTGAEEPLGFEGAPRCSGDDLLEALALLLAEVARGVEGFVRPR
jgi:hypothetical protein